MKGRLHQPSTCIKLCRPSKGVAASTFIKLCQSSKRSSEGEGGSGKVDDNGDGEQRQRTDGDGGREWEDGNRG